jgi:hypothetical protein
MAGGAIEGIDVVELACRVASEPITSSPSYIDAYLLGFLFQIADDTREKLLVKLITRLAAGDGDAQGKIVRLLKNFPFKRSTWRLVDRLDTDLQRRYWTEAYPNWLHQTGDEVEEMVRRLLETNRPRSALRAARFGLKEIESATLVRLLIAFSLSCRRSD